MSSNKLEQLLAQAKPFSEALPAHLRKMAACAVLRRFRPQETVCNHEAWLHSIWFSATGALRVVQYHAAGAQVTTLVTGPRAAIGCLDPFCARRHWQECFAVTDAEVVFVPRGLLQQLVRNDHALCLAVVRHLNERLWEDRELRLAAQLPSEPRLISVLLVLYRKLGHRIPLGRRGIAEVCGMTRETVIRILSPLEKKGCIRSPRGALEILRPDALETSLRGA